MGTVKITHKSSPTHDILLESFGPWQDSEEESRQMHQALNVALKEYLPGRVCKFVESSGWNGEPDASPNYQQNYAYKVV